MKIMCSDTGDLLIMTSIVHKLPLAVKNAANFCEVGA